VLILLPSSWLHLMLEWGIGGGEMGGGVAVNIPFTPGHGGSCL
jgi:hypothetical protein